MFGDSTWNCLSTEYQGPQRPGGVLPLGRCSRRFWRVPVGEIVGTQNSGESVRPSFIHVYEPQSILNTLVYWPSEDASGLWLISRIM